MLRLLESGTAAFTTTVLLGIVSVAALILSIINFYFEQLKGAEITAFAWQVSHDQRLGGNGTTSGYFAFTNDGNRTGIVRAVFLRFLTGEKYPMQITAGVGQKGFPIPLPPEQTEFRILYADYPKTEKMPEYSFEFEMYPKRIGKIQYEKIEKDSRNK
jgi:hypothetical protein